MIGMVKGDFRTHQVSLKGLKRSYAQLEREGRSVIPVKAEPVREEVKALPKVPGFKGEKVQKVQDQTVQSGQKKTPPKKAKKKPDFQKHVVPKKKINPELTAKIQAKKKRLAELEKELKEMD